MVADLVAILGSAAVPTGLYVQPEEDLIVRCIVAAALDAGIAREEIRGVIGMTPRPRTQRHYDAAHVASGLGLKLDYMVEIDMSTLGICNALLAAAAAIEERDLPAVAIFAATSESTVESPGYSASGAGKPSDAGLVGPFDMAPIAWTALGAHQMLAAGEATERDFAAVSVRLRQSATLNPLAYLRAPLTLEEVLGSDLVAAPLRALMICPRTDGAGAIIVASPEFARQRNARRAVLHAGHGFAHDGENACAETAGSSLFELPSTASAMRDVLERTSLDLGALGLVEPWTPFSPTEIMVMRGLGFGRDYACTARVSTSGGLLSRGDSLQATGFYALHEIVQQLRGEADGRQVDDLRYAMTSTSAGNFEACAVDIFSRFDGGTASRTSRGARVGP